MTKAEEPLMTIQATPNEVIAMNAVITHHLKHPADIPEDVLVLLRAFQNRLVEHLPTQITKSLQQKGQ